MFLTTRSKYGTRIILDIALFGQEKPVRIGEIADRQGVSVKYLEKIVQSLRKARFIRSKRGPNGGHMLRRPLDQMSVGQVVRALDGNRLSSEGLDAEDVLVAGKDSTLCLNSRIWSQAHKAMLDTLDAISFAELVEEASLERGSALQKMTCAGLETNDPWRDNGRIRRRGEGSRAFAEAEA